ncbi:hypothetical protein K8P03_06540 [Anaerococcus murdochii]|uniref:Uncharacterized protein n=1 Tax=Anaerococcus murdochii TaxID=411577 RepID=A0ABS7SZL5_9FIRM|nr:hypothetical protein [Anaerococcus murdochii]MBZ2386936.1 hypothetical protein [Anaerococcus murdochii]
MLIVVLCNNIGQLKKSKSLKNYLMVTEEKNMQDFFYDYRDNFSFFDSYWLFDPHKDTELKRESLEDIEKFAQSLYDFTKNLDLEEENKIIEKYNLSQRKIETYGKKLASLARLAIEKNMTLVGLGD